jgi:hypothetical protein
MFLPGCGLWCRGRTTDSECGSDIQQDSLLDNIQQDSLLDNIQRDSLLDNIQQDSLLDNIHPVSFWEPEDTRHMDTLEVLLLLLLLSL